MLLKEKGKKGKKCDAWELRKSFKSKLTFDEISHDNWFWHDCFNFMVVYAFWGWFHE